MTYIFKFLTSTVNCNPPTWNLAADSRFSRQADAVATTNPVAQAFDILSSHIEPVFEGELPFDSRDWLEYDWLTQPARFRPLNESTGQSLQITNRSDRHNSPGMTKASPSGPSGHLWGQNLSGYVDDPSLVPQSSISRPLTDPLASWKRQMCLHCECPNLRIYRTD
jgi:hypothetical protein